MKKFLCAVAVATMMMSCGGASKSGEEAQDSIVTDTTMTQEVSAALEAPAVPFEKTGNELLDTQLESISKIVAEIKAANTKEEKSEIMSKAEAQIEQWQKDNEEAGSKIDPALLEKFKAEFERLSFEMMKEVM